MRRFLKNFTYYCFLFKDTITNTIDATTNDMIVPFGIFVVGDPYAIQEDRTRHYLSDQLNQLYRNQLAQLPENPQNLVHLYELQEYIDLLNKLNRRVKIEV